jgi:hypothetical protein
MYSNNDYDYWLFYSDTYTLKNYITVNVSKPTSVGNVTVIRTFPWKSVKYPNEYTKHKSISQLRQLIAGFPPQRPGFEPRSGHVGFVVDKVTLG